jgi:Ca2+-binding RTX toxin-like protein
MDEVYTSTTGTLTIAPNSSFATLTIPILNDNLNETDEAFLVTLSNPVNAFLDPDASIGEVTITDTLQTRITRTLPTNVENLKLNGTSAINGTGNAGNNIITGNNANNTLSGKAGKDTLTGGGGSDRFDYKNLSDSLLANPDVITDFNANSSNDLLLVTNARSGFTNAGAVTALTAAGINAKLTSANFAANYAAQFTFGTRTFVAINDATAGFNATTDAIIEVTGLTGILTTANFVTV